jgi:uncharacterized iron-regulated membrane protein
VTPVALRSWYVIHKWSSLIPTVFLIVLCITGLPLIFRDELRELLGDEAVLPAVAADAAPVRLDEVARRALAARPGEVLQFLSFSDDRPVVSAITAPRIDSPPERAFVQPFDLRSGLPLAAPPQRKGFLYFMLKLHEDLFLDLPGKLFLGLMGVLLVLAIVSGVVVYAPFMRRLEFGTVRLRRSRRLGWLDIHNLAGIVTVAWLGVVGVTGIINTLNPVIVGLWRAGQLAQMTAPYRNAPPLHALSSVDAAIATTLAAAPGMKVSTIAFPGTRFSSSHHYAVFVRGSEPVSSRLLKPALIDAETGKLTDMREMPLYVRILFLSEPLHFGDYGGMVLKIVWACLDLTAIAVLGSGIYLWLGRRRAPHESRIAELINGGELANTP